MTFDEIIFLVCGCASILITAILNIVNYVRTGKLPSRVSSRVETAFLQASLLALKADSQSDQQTDLLDLQSDPQPVIQSNALSDMQIDRRSEFGSIYVDHDYDEVVMSRAMYSYFLDCEKRCLGGENGSIE